MRPGFLTGYAFFLLEIHVLPPKPDSNFQSGGIYIYIYLLCVCVYRRTARNGYMHIYIHTHLKNDIDHFTIVYGKLCFHTFLYCHTTITPTGKHSKLSCVKFETITRAKFTIIWFPHHLLKLLI